MADRTSAGIFGDIFDYLAENPDERAREMSRRVWEAASAYDFNWYQMDCDDALIKLGLAKIGVRREYPEDGEVVLYLHEDYDE